MKSIKNLLVILFALLLSESLLAQKFNTVGIRLIDPMGVTFKHYTTHHKAFEIGIGTIPDDWLGPYYKGSFETKDKYEQMWYRESDRDQTLYLFGRLLMQYPIPVVDLKGSLEWYWGVGAVFKTAEVTYYYSTLTTPYEYFVDEVTDIDLGTDFIGGLEYTFENAPFTVYTELSLFLEIVDRTHIRALGGIGGRFRF
ncbi:MAG TPA: hypothetical protein VGK59_16965 [Ohtaekwangia sp.]